MPASQIIIRLIEKAVTQTGSYDGSDKQGIQQRIEKRLRNSLPSEKASEDKPSQNES
jgi:hypothetical protein